MAEDVKVLNISTSKSVQNVRELRKYIDELRKSINAEGKSLEENKKDADELRAAQGLLRDIMYSSTKTVDDLKKSTDEMVSADGKLLKSIDGVTVSYNELVHQLDTLKRAWRETTDEAERAVLTEEINKVNNALKDLDETTGSFKRNVGNYTASFKKAFAEIPSFCQPAKKAIDDVTKSVGLLSSHPIVGVIMMLLPVIQRITAALKENETAQQSVKKVMDAIKPIAEALRALIEKIAGWISVATDRVLEWAGQNIDAFKRVVTGAVGVGNAIKEFILTPIRSTISAVKGLGDVIGDVFKGRWSEIKGDAQQALEGITSAFKQGFSFKANFEAGKEAGEAFIDGIGAAKERAKDKGVEIGDAVADGIEEALELREVDISRFDEIMDVSLRRRIEAEKKAAEEQAIIDKAMTELEADTVTEIETLWDEHMDYMVGLNDRYLRLIQDRITIAFTYANSMQSIIGSIADIMEAESDGSEKVAKQVKNLRIASAVIDTISGTISAYMSGVKAMLGSPIPWAGIILGAAQAATVAAAGAAQIAKLRNTKIGKDASSSSATVTAPAAAVTPAPLPQTVQQSAAVESAYNTRQLNERSADIQVYILQSDLEASGRQVQVRQDETTF